MTHKYVLRFLILLVGLTLTACDKPDDNPAPDGAGLSDGLMLDGVGQDVRGDGVSDSGGDIANTGNTQTIHDVISGAALSKSSSYELFSQVGHWQRPVKQTSTSYTVIWSAVTTRK